MIGWRLVQLPFILFAVYTITFLLAWQIPGNPLEKDGRRPPQEVMEQMQAQYNLDDPVAFYGDYIWKASGLAWVSGDRSGPVFNLGPSLRHENWKIIFGKGHGGFSSIKQSVSRKPIQLYDMKSDVGETKNVASSHPEVVEQLRAMMAGYVTHGRSTPGTAQSNDGPKHWSQLKSIIKK